ncbi:hypothetical protein P280DRAFT_97268 [Massarina eburnea CBS 473.64]|uniref:Uncharacterized protein n=1 Tax=Massarina eburnea CBS 473.64 TaxID=1395130 RepID=A0A6A6RR39_9PLEO|nr:hypothetical protein P280DRAFT_97268 [Massarina eburnea CBS 473.64]
MRWRYEEAEAKFKSNLRILSTMTSQAITPDLQEIWADSQVMLKKSSTKLQEMRTAQKQTVVFNNSSGTTSPETLLGRSTKIPTPPRPQSSNAEKSDFESQPPVAQSERPQSHAGATKSTTDCKPESKSFCSGAAPSTRPLLENRQSRVFTPIFEAPPSTPSGFQNPQGFIQNVQSHPMQSFNAYPSNPVPVLHTNTPGQNNNSARHGEYNGVSSPLMPQTTYDTNNIIPNTTPSSNPQSLNQSSQLGKPPNHPNQGGMTPLTGRRSPEEPTILHLSDHPNIAPNQKSDETSKRDDVGSGAGIATDNNKATDLTDTTGAAEDAEAVVKDESDVVASTALQKGLPRVYRQSRLFSSDQARG